MIVLMVMHRFVYKIRDGTKRCTIRKVRIKPVQKGDILSIRHWVDKPYRSKQITIVTTQCLAVERVTLTLEPREEGVQAICFCIDGRKLTPGECESLALKDGFERKAERGAFWDLFRFIRDVHGLPFRGDLIHW